MASTKSGKAKADAFSSLRFVPCEVEPGMFEEEYLVHLSAKDPENPKQAIRVKLFVDKRDVAGIQREPKKSKPEAAYLRVEIARRSKGLALVVLPQPAVPDTESVFIDEADIRDKVEVSPHIMCNVMLSDYLPQAGMASQFKSTYARRHIRY